MLRVFHGDNGEALVSALAELLLEPAADPLAAEIVVVHTRGMERWISQRLATHLGVATGGDGICANVDFPFPVEVVRRGLKAVGGPDPRYSAWAPDRLLWHLLALLEAGLPSWGDPLTHRAEAQPTARLALLRHVADLLDTYQAHRPDMVLAWLEGDDVDSKGAPLPEGDLWQPHLVRELRDRIGEKTPAEWTAAAATALRAGTVDPAALPARLALFGLTALPAAYLSVLHAMASVCQVNLLLLHPSPAAWEAQDLKGTIDEGGLPILPPRRPPTTGPGGNRLLRSWGRDSREIQVVVRTVAPDAPDVPATTTRPGVGETLLARLQADIRADRDPVAGAPLPWTAADSSLQLHGCHGPARQVQVLRDEILRLMAADPTLKPRDIVVMCPDVEAFAPLVGAHLASSGDDDERPNLRIRLADRALRQANPLLAVVEDLLAMAATRVTGSSLRDLLATEVVGRRFGLSTEDHERVAEWLEGTKVFWGLGAADRERDGLVGLRAGSLDEGLDRLLLGVAMADEDLRTLGDITPLDDIEGPEAATAGRLAEFAARLEVTLESLRTEQPVASWADALVAAADRLTLAPYGEPGQRKELTDIADDLRQAGGGVAVTIGLAEVRELLGDRLKGRPSWANHRTGDLTVCTLVPMRSVPHRVVCLLGMDDEVFPRRVAATADDVIARDPRMGDRDPRSEDRQLLLDALMAASDAVVVTYTAVGTLSGDERQPCIPVSELLRTVDSIPLAGPAADHDDPLSKRITIRHTLHPHDPAAFEGPRPGFDPLAYAAASAQVQASAQPPAKPPVAVPAPSRPLAGVVPLEDLVAFARDPAEFYFRRALGVYLPDPPQRASESLPVDIDGLTQWSLGDWLLRSGAYADPARAQRTIAVMRGRGQLPIEPFGARKLREAVDNAKRIAHRAVQAGVPMDQPGGHRELEVVLGARTIIGSVAGIHEDIAATVTYSKLNGKNIVPAWVRLVALTAAQPDVAWRALIVGRKDDKTAGPHAVEMGPLGMSREGREKLALELLADLLEMHDDALAGPLIAPAKPAAEYAKARVHLAATVAEAGFAAALPWDPVEWGSSHGESQTPAHMLLLGDAVAFDHLEALPPRPADVRPGDDPETHAFGALAVRIWSPLLQNCRAAR